MKNEKREVQNAKMAIGGLRTHAFHLIEALDLGATSS
jgi:hypothetical protein